MTAPRRLQADQAAVGARLDAWVAGCVPELSRARVQALIAEGALTVDGAPARASQRLRVGQEVTFLIPAAVPATPAAEDIALAVVHDDPLFLVVDKPAGLVVHPGAGTSSGTLVNALLHHVRDLSGVGGVLRPGIVHRLDRGTSGLMVVAKSDEAHRSLAAQFLSRTVEKEYLAVVHGVPARASGVIDAAIGRDPVHRKRMTTRGPRGRASRSTFTVSQRLDGAALLRVVIHTGRTHQIRVHLASIGHPLVGDPTYGGGREPSSRRPEARAAIRAFPRPALHAARLAFSHPRSGERLAFVSPLPADVAELVAAAMIGT